MSVISVDHGAGGWQAVPRALLEDERLSLAAKGFMCWILAKPPGWQVRPAWCQTQFGLSSEKWGKLTKELVAAGYYHRLTNRGENGQLTTSITITPVSTLSPSPCLPAPGEPGSRLTKHSADRIPGQPGGLLETSKEKTLKNPAGPPLKTPAGPPVAGFDEIVIAASVVQKGLLSEGEVGRLKALALREKNGQQLVDELIEQLYLQGRHPEGSITDPVGYLIRLKTSSGLTRAGEGMSRRLRSTPALSISELLSARGGSHGL